MPCHLLIATDLSKAAGEVYRHGAALSRLTGARVTLLSVNESHLGGLPVSSVSAKYLERVDEERVRSLLAARQTLRAMGVEVVVQSGRGDPADQICTFAHIRDVDLVVMAARPQGHPDRVGQRVDPGEHPLPGLLVKCDLLGSHVGVSLLTCSITSRSRPAPRPL
jgi:nucleotide-binding universal stress UspA family protein